MTVLRAFIALEIPVDIKKALDLETASLRQRTGSLVRWVSPENTHLTLKFLGDVQADRLDALSQVIQVVCNQQAPFEITTGSLGCFPNAGRPRVIWIGLDAPADLLQLRGRLADEMTGLGFPVDAHGFSAHLTIGRVREQVAPGDLKKLVASLVEQKISGSGSFSVRSVTLFKSELRPGGPLYTALFVAHLGI